MSNETKLEIYRVGGMILFFIALTLFVYWIVI